VVNNDNAGKKPVSSVGNYKFNAPKFGLTVPGVPQAGGLGALASGQPGASLKRPSGGVAHPPPKKQKTGILRDVTLAEAGKFGTLNEYAFFDKVRKALRTPEVYDNFLRCLVLFNQEVISRAELIQLTTPFLSRHAELFKWFKDFVGYRDSSFSAAGGGHEASGHERGATGGLDDDRNRNEPERGARDRISGDSALEIGNFNVLSLDLYKLHVM
jgi:hypothetical protein